MRAIGVTVLHLIITPVVLILYGLTPVNHLDVFAPRQALLERLLTVSVLALWIVWLWGAWSVFVSARRHKSPTDRNGRLTAPHITLALATLLAALGGEQSPAGTFVGSPVFVDVHDDEKSGETTRVETAALAALSGVLLQRFFERQRVLSRSARRGSGYARHPRLVQLILHRLFVMRKGAENPKHCQVDSSGAISIVDDLNHHQLLPLGYGPTGCISVRLGFETTLTIDSALDVAGIVRFIESVRAIDSSPDVQQVCVWHEFRCTKIQIRLPSSHCADGLNETEYRLTASDDYKTALLEPGDVRLVPFGFSSKRKDEFFSLSKCLQLKPLPKCDKTSDLRGSESIDLVVRVMGPLEIVCSDGRQIHFKKTKSAELLAWLVLHRDRPSRDIARTAMWESNVQDSTFNNVVSELRRAVKDAIPTLDLTDSRHQRLINIPRSIRTDVELMEDAWNFARRHGSPDAWLTVYEHVQQIRGLPFESTKFDWADAEGLTSHIVLKAMNVCCDLADYLLQQGDIKKVFQVTEQGLRALPGSEEMLAFREKAMRLRSTGARSSMGH